MLFKKILPVLQRNEWTWGFEKDGTTFFLFPKTFNMNEDKDITRNRPSDEGRRNDPDMRDETATQPGVQTISPSSGDEANQAVTGSAMQGSETTQFDTDDRADPTLDDIDRRDDL